MSYGLNVEMHKQVRNPFRAITHPHWKKEGEKVGAKRGKNSFFVLCGRRCGVVVVVVIVTPSRVRCDLHAQKEEVDPCRVSLAGCQLRMGKEKGGGERKWGQGERE